MVMVSLSLTSNSLESSGTDYRWIILFLMWSHFTIEIKRKFVLDFFFSFVIRKLSTESRQVVTDEPSNEYIMFTSLVVLANIRLL